MAREIQSGNVARRKRKPKGNINQRHFPGKFDIDNPVVAYVLCFGYEKGNEIPEDHRGELGHWAAKRLALITLGHINDDRFKAKVEDARQKLTEKLSAAMPEEPEFHLAKRQSSAQPALAGA